MGFGELYRVHEHPWGSLAEEAVKDVAANLEPGTVLDLGVGDGRNVLFLAQSGWEVTGVDLVPEAIGRLLQHAKDLGVEDRVAGLVQDAAEFVPERHYDLVLSGFTLHFLKEDGFLGALDTLRRSVRPGGVAIVTDFTRNGPLYRPGTTKHWLREGELLEHFSGWEVLRYAERDVKTRAKDDQGRQLLQQAAEIVARKPEA